VNYLLVAVAEIRLHERLVREAPERLVLPMWFFPYASWATAGVIVAVLVAMAVTPDLQSQFFSSAVAVGVALAAFMVVRRGR